MGRPTAFATKDVAPAQPATFRGSNRVIISRAGYEVDTSRSTWRVPHPTGSLSLHWKELSYVGPSIWDATANYVRHLIENFSIGEVDNNWRFIRVLTILPSVVASCKNNTEIPLQFFTEYENTLPQHEKYRLHFARKLYTWCSDAGFSIFSPEVAFHLEQRAIGGNEKGNAVRSADPEQGPLQDGEVNALVNALRAGKNHRRDRH